MIKEKIIAMGGGGFSTEILHLVELIQEKSKRWNQVFFIDETMEPFSKELRGVKVVGGLEVIEKTEAEIDVVITINNTDKAAPRGQFLIAPN